MKFIGQEVVRKRLLESIVTGRIPHALLLYGTPGAGKLPIAIDFAQTLLCTSPHADGTPCGECLSCRMAALLEHPDLHFSFPVINKAGTDKAVSDAFSNEWREQLLRNPYFDLNDWLVDMGAQTQQAQYYVAESDAIQRKLALKSSQGGRKVVVIWLPEKMNGETANKLLKLLEEPPADTCFILVTEDIDNILPTILSRTQRMLVPPLSAREIEEGLAGVDVNNVDVHAIARLAHGSFTAALASFDGLKNHANADTEFFEWFAMLMRMAYKRDVGAMREWSNTLSSVGREKQKHFLTYAQRMLRESFIYNFRQPDLNYLTPTEEQFTAKFARFVNEKNIIALTSLIEQAERDIAGNVNTKMVLFDTALQLTRLINR